MTPIIELEGISKTFESPDRTIRALDDVSFSVAQGERLAVVGRSGAGKSTLLNILGLLDQPSAGTYRLMNDDVAGLAERQRDMVRRDSVGFVFQSYQILGNLSASDNLRLKLAISRVPANQRSARVDDALGAVGLSSHAESLGRNLSGGEKQRLAIARALLNDPPLVLADEPTGNLDSENAGGVLELLTGLAARRMAVVVITHDERLASWADRVVRLENGKVVAR